LERNISIQDGLECSCLSSGRFLLNMQYLDVFGDI
jgi:hypothetical protein